MSGHAIRAGVNFQRDTYRFVTMNTETFSGAHAEASRREADLIAAGYRLVPNADEGSLMPGEYLRRTFAGTPVSFQGPGGCVLIWCPLPI